MIVDQFGTPVSSRAFANAADRSDRSRPPEPVFKEDFAKLVPDMDRQMIVSSSRRLFQNFGPIAGAIIQKADHVVGRAWNPKFTGADREWGDLARDWLENQWFGSCDVRGRAWDFKTLLWLDSVAIDRDGDFLIYLTESESGYPQTQRIAVNRIASRGHTREGVLTEGDYKGRRISHGVVLSETNRAIAYHVLGDTPADDKYIPADRCIHVFDPLWHDQVRGIPSFTASIKLIYGSMTATEREQMNQLVRSSIALVEYNEAGAADMDDPANQRASDEDDAPVIQSYAGGMIKYFRSNSGGKVEALDTDMPGNGWDTFQDRVVRTAMSGINWPSEMVWKSSEANASLVRNIQERARMSVEDRQDVIKSPALFVIRYAVAKAIKAGILPKPKTSSDWWKWDFQMPRKFSVDIAKDAAQRRDDFRIGFRSRTDIASEDGKDVDQIENEKIEEAFRFEKKIRAREEEEGITLDRSVFQMLTPNGNPQSAAQPAEEKQQEDDE